MVTKIKQNQIMFGTHFYNKIILLKYYFCQIFFPKSLLFHKKTEKKSNYFKNFTYFSDSAGSSYIFFVKYGKCHFEKI